MTKGDVERLQVGEPIAMRVMLFQTPGAIAREGLRRGRVARPWSHGHLSVEWSDGTREVLGEHNLPDLLP